MLKLTLSVDNVKSGCIFVKEITTKTNTMTPQELIKAEYKRRTDLVENVEFRKTCVEIAKKIGITVEEWNENKVQILLMFANKVCGIENQLN